MSDVETVKMTLDDTRKLGLSWYPDLYEHNGGNDWAVNEGLVRENDMVEVPVSLLKRK
jgi:hypothetical protein